MDSSLEELFPPIEAPQDGWQITSAPYDYQERDHDETFRMWDEGIVGTMTRIFTGGGKTYSTCNKARTWLNRGSDYYVMIISYEKQLVWQFAQEVEDFLGITPGIEMEKEHVDLKNMPRVIVASRQSLELKKAPPQEVIDELQSLGVSFIGACNLTRCQSYLKAIRSGESVESVREDIERFNSRPEVVNGVYSRLHKFDPKLNWMIVFDEAHKHAYKLVTVGHIVDWFEKNPRSRRTGMTATPKRSDGVSLGNKMFPGVAIDYPLFHRSKPCAIKDGYAVPYVQKYIEVAGVDFANIKKIAGDFDDADLERVLGEESTLAKLVEPLLDLVGDRRTLIFSPGVAMAQNVSRYINARVQTLCPGCQLVKWYPVKLIGDGAVCSCGRNLEQSDITKSGEQAQTVWGELHPNDRKEIYRSHQTGIIQFLSVCGLCVAAGTRVITDAGEVPIESVTKSMKLWDGVEFVSHDGVVFKGIKPVIQYAGLKATEDHNVWTKNGWKRFAMCKEHGTSISVSAIGGKAVRESCGYYRDNYSDWQESSGWAGSAMQWLRKNVCEVLQRIKNRSGWLQAVFQIFWSTKLVADALSVCKEEVRKSKGRILSGLWSARNPVPVFIAGRDGPMDHEESWSIQGIDSRSRGQQQALRTRQYPLGNSKGTSKQQENSSQRVQEKVEVYDILNAGPRHRFTANGLIVSNCREGYNDPDISCVAVFRPVSKKASSLAEQMKGRGCRVLRGLIKGLKTREERLQAIATSAKPNCLVVDLVGISGLADCASTVQIYSDGVEDEVVARAEKKLAESDEEMDVEDAIESAQHEIDEERQRIKEERLEAERQAKEEAEQRAKAGVKVNYTTHDTGTGNNNDGNGASDAQLRFIRFLGMEVKKRISKKQAGRIINQLRQRMDLQEVAALNRMDAEEWEEHPPSDKQFNFMRWKGVPSDGIRSGYDASQRIDAKMNPQQFADKKTVEIYAAKNNEELTAIGHDLKIAQPVLDYEVYGRLVAVGKLRRKEFNQPEKAF